MFPLLHLVPSRNIQIAFVLLYTSHIIIAFIPAIKSQFLTLLRHRPEYLVVILGCGDRLGLGLHWSCTNNSVLRVVDIDDQSPAECYNMPSSLSQPTNAKVLSLPPELVEQALILSAAGGFPSAIACLAQTCRYFHQLIYRSTDNHLWREVFLTTFDDPRPLLGRLRAATAFAPTGDTITDIEPPFDWAGEFTSRIGAKKLFEKYTRDSSIEVSWLIDAPKTCSYPIRIRPHPTCPRP